MGIEVLLRGVAGSDPARAKAVAATLGLTLIEELVHEPSDSVRLILAQPETRSETRPDTKTETRPETKTVTLTFNADGTIHAVWLGRPRSSPEAETALIRLLLPGARVIGSNPAYDPADLEEE